MTFLWGCSTTTTPPDEKPNMGLQTPITGALTDTLRVGTLNMSVGWRAEGLVLKKLNDTLEVHGAVSTLYQQFESSLPCERIRVMAQAIVENPVDVLALQEVQVMRFNDAPAFHFLDTLLWVLDSLEGGSQWQVVRQQINKVHASVSPTQESPIDIEFWEGQATLVRHPIQILDSDSAVFSKLVSFPILSENFDSERGYIRTTLQTPQQGIWQIFNTHLEVELLSLFNTPQGIELNQHLWDQWLQLHTGAQVVLGDLNAYHGKGALGALTSPESGLLDAWVLHHGAESPESYTCCIENLNTPEEGAYDRRLDYILVRQLLSVDDISSIPLRGTQVWGGDHAYVRAILVQQLPTP